MSDSERKPNTVFVNLWGGPGTSKSTNAAFVFATLKRLSYNAELIAEYAKKKVWGNEMKTLGHQLYVTAKQTHAQFNLLGEVEVAVTDSPILLGPLIYPGFGSTPSFLPYMKEVFAQFNNLNIFLTRNPDWHPYNPKGRTQTEHEAMALDVELRRLMAVHEIEFEEMMVGPDVVDNIVSRVVKKIEESRSEG